MQDYDSIYTWALDKQAQMRREAQRWRLLRQSRQLNLRLRWPLPRRREDR